MIEGSAAVSYAPDSALLIFLLYTLGVFSLAWMSNRLLRSKSFLSEYFLGSRSLGVWAFALTFAATSASGGSFTGFPSKIYSHGWILGLWIGSYIVVPICGMGILGKRINQIARRTGAITVPDVIRDRFNSPAFGVLATSLIVFFMSINLTAQFKSGSLILKTLLNDVPLFQSAIQQFSAFKEGSSLLVGVDSGYLLCLLIFAVAVIVYTTYGGFHAVVWTDVMQGVVMGLGVLVLLPLALIQVGGLGAATEQFKEMTPPLIGTARLELKTITTRNTVVPTGTWITLGGSGDSRVLRTAREVVIPAGSRQAEDVDVLEITTPSQRRQLEEQIRANKLPSLSPDLRITVTQMEAYRYGADKPGTYLTGPGPDRHSDLGFLPFSLAVSFFFMWAISGSGQPSNMVRLMAFNTSQTLRRSIFTVSIYYSLIYFPLVIIFCCARIFLPGMDLESDRIMPATAVFLSAGAGVPWLAGILVAAPFAAVMSTVDSFLLVISSALVRDVYQRNINPDVSERRIKRMTYICTTLVGLAAVAGAVSPPQFLQDIIVYTGSGLAACFLAPVALGLYWPRVNATGAIAGMLGGFSTHLLLYIAGYAVYGRFASYRLLGLDPLIWGLLASFLLVVLVSRITPPPPQDLVRRYFYRES